MRKTGSYGVLKQMAALRVVDDASELRAPAGTALTVMPAPPPNLNKEEKTLWRHVGALLVDEQILTEVDLYAFRLLVGVMAECDALRAVVKKGGASYPTRTAKGERLVRVRPEALLLPECERRVLVLMGKFGITPADRSKVTQAPLPELNGKGRNAKAQRAALGAHDVAHDDGDREFQ